MGEVDSAKERGFFWVRDTFSMSSLGMKEKIGVSSWAIMSWAA